MTGGSTFNDFQQKAFDLCLAVYRLVKLFPEKEPINSQIKALTNEITADILIIERIGQKLPLNIPASAVKNLFDELSLAIIKNTDKLVGYLEIARACGWLKPVNFDILIKEYQKLLSYLAERATILVPTKERPGAFYPAVPREAEYTKPALSIPIPTVAAPKPKPKVSKPAPKKELNSRQKKILDFLQKHREAKMADFLTIFKDEVTERTLRNDLRGLTEQKLIRAEGEFKTRRYYIL